MQIPIQISGIPALAEITTYHVQPPFRGSPHLCDSDWDYYGYTELEYEICDRRGRPAPWLERKLNPDSRRSLDAEILETLKSREQDYDPD